MMFFLSWVEWLLLFLILGFLFYKWTTAKYDFFAKKEVVFAKPVPLFGNFFPVISKKRTMHETVIDLYNQFEDKKFFGMFQFRLPLLAIRDPELIKQVAVKNFDHFSNHLDFVFSEDVEPLFGKSLIMMKDQKWRDMRATLSPAFTGSKMRHMFELVTQCAVESTEMLLDEAKAKERSDGDKKFVPELKDVFARCTNDVIASTAFGIQVNSLKDRDNSFYTMGAKTVKLSILMVSKSIFISKFPKLSKFLRLKIFNKDTDQFFKTIVRDTMQHRSAHDIVRSDMIQLLMESKRGSLQTEEETNHLDGFATVAESTDTSNNGNGKRVWTDEDYTAQCFLFFIAGFETSSTLMCVAAHELMEYHDVQMRLVAEIDAVRERLNGQPLTYEILQKMPYMDMVICESLRKWSPAMATDRMCTKPFELVDETTGDRVTIEKGDGIWIPIHALHRDPKYFPDPDKFDPERFSVENLANIQPFTYLPFGVGPRNCIASRFALMQAKAFLFYLLSSFTFEVASNTNIPLRLVQNGFGLIAEKGYNVHLRPR